MNKIQVLDYEITTKTINSEDYVSLTDIAKRVNSDEPRFVIQNWMRKYTTKILTVLDSRRLKKKLDVIDLRCLQQNG